MWHNAECSNVNSINFTTVSCLVKNWPRGLCSTQLSTKFQLLIKTKIPTNEKVFCFKSLRCCIYHANKCENANDCWHFNIYEQDKFRAQLS